MNRNLFIGLGGSGIKTIDLIKQHVFSSDNSHIEASAFCAIDTDMISLDNCKSLSSREFVNINVESSYERYIVDKERYDIPDKNIEALRYIGSWGSGTIRSNGHFCFLFNKAIIEKTLFSTYYKLTDVRLTCELGRIDGIYVHLFFSLSGGTGSGIFYDVANLVKKIMPRSFIIYYVFSNTYFRGYSSYTITRRMSANAVASLFELNNMPILHNRLIYIDNKYYIGEEAIISINCGIDDIIKRSVEKTYGNSLFIDSPSYERILDFESFETIVNNERYSPFSICVFENIYNNMQHNEKA